MNANPLTFAESRIGNICIVSLAGRIDSTNATNLIARLNDVISSGPKSIVVDLGEVLYLTSAAFRALLVATDAGERNQAKIVLCNVVGQVRELFEMGGLWEAFTIFPSRDAALAQLG
jgi:stage II sporulation protein AA (anti-sigma F factor antagonist)